MHTGAVDCNMRQKDLAAIGEVVEGDTQKKKTNRTEEWARKMASGGSKTCKKAYSNNKSTSILHILHLQLQLGEHTLLGPPTREMRPNGLSTANQAVNPPTHTSDA